MPLTPPSSPPRWLALVVLCAACLPKTEETPDDEPCTTLDWLFGGECSTQRDSGYDSGWYSNDSGWYSNANGWSDTGSSDAARAARADRSGACLVGTQVCVSGVAERVEAWCDAQVMVGASSASFHLGQCSGLADGWAAPAAGGAELPKGALRWTR